MSTVEELEREIEDLQYDLTAAEDRADDAEQALADLERVQNNQLLDDLQRLIDKWYRLDLKNAEGNYAVHAEALETIVKKYQ